MSRMRFLIFGRESEGLPFLGVFCFLCLSHKLVLPSLSFTHNLVDHFLGVVRSKILWNGILLVRNVVRDAIWALSGWRGVEEVIHIGVLVPDFVQVVHFFLLVVVQEPRVSAQILRGLRGELLGIAFKILSIASVLKQIEVLALGLSHRQESQKQARCLLWH